MNPQKSTINSGSSARSTGAVAAALSGALAEATGSPPAIRIIPSDAREAARDVPPNMLWWRSSAPPAIWIGLSEVDAALLLGMRNPDLPGELPASAAVNLSGILDRSWGSGEMGTESPADPDAWDALQIEFSSGTSVRFFVAQPDLAPTVAHNQADSNLGMLLDIELPITLRFGSAQMALRDIAGLTTGSVIEFARGVDEPVEVMVNGHVVALGEAVTVKGCYGVRISEISSRRDRLAASPFATAGDNRETAGEIA